MNILRHGSGVSYKVVTATSVLLLALVIGAPGILGHMGSVAASDVPTAYGGRAYGVYTEVPLYGGTYFADTGSLPAEGGVLPSVDVHAKAIDAATTASATTRRTQSS